MPKLLASRRKEGNCRSRRRRQSCIPSRLGASPQCFSAKSGNCLLLGVALEEHECPREEHISACIHDLAIDLPKVFSGKPFGPRAHVDTGDCAFLLPELGEMSHVGDLGLAANVWGVRADDALTWHLCYLTEYTCAAPGDEDAFLVLRAPSWDVPRLACPGSASK